MTTRALRSVTSVAALAVLALLLVSCGDDDGNDEGAAPGQTDVTAAEPGGDEDEDHGGDGGDSDEPPPEDAEDPVICEVPEPTEMGLGSETDGEFVAGQFPPCWWVEVPDGLDSLTFELSGLTDDLNLAAVYGFPRAILTYWDATDSGTADESLTIEAPVPGPYFVRVTGTSPTSESSFTLGVLSEPATTTEPTGRLGDPSAECVEPAITLEPGDSVDGEITVPEGDVPSIAYYCVEVPEGANGLSVNLTGLTGNIDLLVRRMLVDATVHSDRSRGGDTRSVVVESPEPGAYYIEVAAALDDAESPFTLEIDGS